MALSAIEKKTMRIAERLKDARLEREWSQETLANKAGIDLPLATEAGIGLPLATEAGFGLPLGSCSY